MSKIRVDTACSSSEVGRAADHLLRMALVRVLRTARVRRAHISILGSHDDVSFHPELGLLMFVPLLFTAEELRGLGGGGRIMQDVRSAYMTSAVDARLV